MLRVCLLLIALISLSANSFERVSVVKGTEYKLVLPDIPIDTVRYGNTSISKIKDVLARRESKHNYFVVNQFGCLGKYQFTVNTLKGLGFTKKEIKEFITCTKVTNTLTKSSYSFDPSLQERAMDSLLAVNYRWLKSNHLLKYNGKYVGGIKVTTEGMLCALHLLGGVSLKDYLVHQGSMEEYYKILKNGKVIFVRKFDGNNTSIKDYLTLF